MAGEPRCPGDLEQGPLGAQPLDPVPVELASDLEKALAAALGLEGFRLVPRLPLGLESCHRGSRCFWSFLARAALEHVAGEQFPQWELPDIVAKVKGELQELRHKVRRDAQTLANLRDIHGNEQREVRDLRALKDRSEKLDMENQELCVANGGLTTAVDKLTKEAKSQGDRLEELEAEVHMLRRKIGELETHLESAESRLNMSLLKRDEAVRGRLEDQRLLQMERAENTRIRHEALEVAILMCKKKTTKPRRKSTSKSPKAKSR